jgi:Recombination, repair and ssDNA binding protein UvsY
MKPLPINEIVDMWEKDAVVDQTDPGKEILRIPMLHSKYVKQHAAHSLAVKSCSIEHSKMKKIKWEYYTGKLNDDSEMLKKYNLEPFRFVLKNDITTYLESDEDLARINAKKALHEQAVEVLNFIIKELNARTYQLRSFIDWEKFIQGQN